MTIEATNGHSATAPEMATSASLSRIRITEKALAVVRTLAEHPADTQAEILREAARILGVPLAPGESPARTTEEPH